ncbi:MAG: hypothetical protein JRJ75_10090 [Deltaproteobacteria bacterium]|nr:hypothetical protein [Deltaproteobacteria bacterium]
MSQEKRSYYKREGINSPAQTGEDPEANDKWNRDMDGQEPLLGELFYICSPIPKG